MYLAIFEGQTICLQTQSENTQVGIKTASKLIKTRPAFNARQAICSSQQTGSYTAHLFAYLQKLSFPIWLKSSLQIKKAGGLPRGKTDANNAQPVRRCGIAEYAFGFRDQTRLGQPARLVMQTLAALSALRQQLLGVGQQTLRRPGSTTAYRAIWFIGSTLQKQLIKHCQASLQAISADLEAAKMSVLNAVRNNGAAL